MGSSFIQSYISSKLVLLLGNLLKEKYIILTNELGLFYNEDRDWKNIDISIYTKDQLFSEPLHNNSLSIPPKVIIEIDTKADISEFESEQSYYIKKTKDLLKFGVERLIWIFTKEQVIWVAERNSKWEICDWSDEVEVIDGVKIQVNNIIQDR